MNRALILALAMSVLPGAGSAQDSTTQTSTSQSGAAAANHSAAQAQSQAASQTGASGGAETAASKIAAGSTLQVVLNKSIDSKKAKVGDEVVAKTTMDALSGGKVVIPRGTKVIGHVTEAKARAKGDSESTVAIAFDKAVLKGGQEIPLSASIQAIAAPLHSADLSTNEPLSPPQPAGGGGYGRASGGGGMVGNTAQTVGSTVGSAANTAGNVGGSAAGVQTGAVLNASSHGVVGLSGIELQSNTSAQAKGSVVASKDKNVKLESGTQMVLQVQSK
jgi:hypothetical protein